MTERRKITTEELIKGFPHDSRGRARTVHRRGLLDAATQLEELLYANSAIPDSEMITKIGAWIKKTKEANE